MRRAYLSSQSIIEGGFQLRKTNRNAPTIIPSAYPIKTTLVTGLRLLFSSLALQTILTTVITTKMNSPSQVHGWGRSQSRAATAAPTQMAVRRKAIAHALRPKDSLESMFLTLY